MLSTDTSVDVTPGNVKAMRMFRGAASSSAIQPGRRHAAAGREQRLRAASFVRAQMMAAEKKLEGNTDLGGCSVLVTGATDGIGRHSALQLARRGADVLVHGRTPAKAEDTLQAVRAAGVSQAQRPVAFGDYDLSSRDETVRLARDVAARRPSLDVCLLNAGVFEASRRATPDGLEMTFAVNVLAPFLLVKGLLPALARSDRPSRPRIVCVSSISHLDYAGLREQLPTVWWDDLQSTARPYDSHEAYGASKFFLLAFSHELARRLAGASDARVRRITANAIDPGTVNTAMLAKGWGSCGMAVEDADDELWAATAAEIEGISGRYYVGRREEAGAALARDPGVGRRLWAELERLAGAPFHIS